MKTKENKILNYFLVYLLLGIPNIPIMLGNEFLVAGFVISLIFFFVKFKKIDKVIVIYTLVFIFLFGLHVLAFNQFMLSIFTAYLLRIFFAYFVIKTVGKNIDVIIVNQIYFFSIISLIVTGAIFANPTVAEYIFSNITPFFDKITLFQPNRQHFIIYTMELGWKVEIPRNSGPFWEPGGFGVFLFIALIFNLVRNKIFFNKKNIIFLVALATTQSTTAYLALFVFVALYILIKYKNIYSYLLIPVLIVIFLNIYSRVAFLEEKVDKMYNESKNAKTEKIYSRLVSGQINLDNFLSSPIFGIGRFIEVADEENTGNNGTTLVLAEFGIIGFLFYFITMYYSFRVYCIRNNFNTLFPVVIIASLFILGYSQGLFQKPFFMGLCFMFLVNFESDKKILNRKNFQDFINSKRKEVLPLNTAVNPVQRIENNI